MPMPRPKIVKETRREPAEREPPFKSACTPHKWLSEESLRLFDRAGGMESPFPLYLSDLAESKIREHAVKEAPRRLEVLGLLLGEVSIWKGATYVDCRDVVTTTLRSSSSKVKFNPDAFPNLFL